MRTEREIIAEWLSNQRDESCTVEDRINAADLLAALEAAGHHIVTEGEAVLSGSVVRVEPATRISARSIYHDRAGQVRAAGDHRILYRWRPRAVTT